MSSLQPIHLATGWETVADAVPDAPAVINGDVERSWAQFDERAARLAGHLHARGIGRGDVVALYLRNANEYLETHFAALKLRAIPINVNYRYRAKEIVYLLDNADAKALVFHHDYRETVQRLPGLLPALAVLLAVGAETLDDTPGVDDYETAIGNAAPQARIARDPADPYMFFTGGTTGRPKGVVYHCGSLQHAFFKTFDRLGLTRPASLTELATTVREIHRKGAAPISLPACPLMHATGLWIGALGFHNLGGAVVTLPCAHFDAAAVLTEIARRGVTNLTLVGDAFARPLVEELERARATGRPYDLSTLKTVSSSGTMWSQPVKDRLLEFTDATLRDVIGSTEGGMGMSESTRDQSATTASFELNDGVQVFDDADRPVTPGSGAVGRIATSEMVPLRYHKDPEKSAATFREVDGIRYSFPGDLATVEADGRIRLLGRGSACINTGGEKVFPEEVEEAIKTRPEIWDCLVVGLPDPQFGQRVAAVISLRDGATLDEGRLFDSLRDELAGYKLPRRIVLAPTIARTPSGKPDYTWARELALKADSTS